MTLVLKTCVYYRNKTTNSLTDKPGLYVFRKVLLYSQERNPEATIEKEILHPLLASFVILISTTLPWMKNIVFKVENYLNKT